ncbi:DUF4274 domain-containing protein [Acinetobacter modestus]|uniref:DUF4274 domain-containing protein n=1 Tax=Acinetobacter modestus TaxID=1776740 RepID=UPI0030187122
MATDTEILADTPSDDLRQLALTYNWDDGFSFPTRIADHPNCDLAVALELFWLANSDAVYLGDSHKTSYNTFSQTLANRILNNHYSIGSGSFELPLTKVQVYNFRQRGLPDIFPTNINGVQA